MKRQPFFWLVSSLLVVFLLQACSTGSALLPVNASRTIKGGSSFGQSFTAQNPGLSAISVFLAPSAETREGSLLFHLRTSPQSVDDLARARLPLAEITRDTYYNFDFSPQSDSGRKDYYLQIEVIGNGQVKIFTAEPDAYIDGSLYENKIPQEAQLAFRLAYDRKVYLLGLVPLILQWLKVLLIGAFVFILPGWGLFSLLWKDWNQLNWPSKLGLSAGLSLAVYPLLFLWTNLIGLHLGAVYAWLPPIAALIALVWKYRRKIINFRIKPFNQRLILIDKISLVQTTMPDIGLLIILGLIIVSRFWVIRSLDVPLFGDSYQHSMIAQLLVDHKGLFNSWQPYADLITFTYHFGFHTEVAVYHWISGISVEQAMLWTGQLINILAILALYPLTYKIAHNRWAAVVAILIAGLLSPMPMMYVNWGRYTQLAGQVILPVAIWMVWSILENSDSAVHSNPPLNERKPRKLFLVPLRNLVITWMILGGLALTHYRVLILWIIFLAAYILLNIKRKNLSDLFLRITWMGIGGAVLFAPWFIHVFGGHILKIFATQITTFPSTRITVEEYFSNIGNIQTYLPLSIWFLLILSSIWGLWKRKKGFIIIFVWWIFVILATNPNWLGLPGAGAISNFTILIAFYIPASIIIGSAIIWTTGLPDLATRSSDTITIRRSSLVFSSLFFLVMIGLAIWGLPKRIKDLDIHDYALVTRPDLRAFEWIDENTPSNSRFLINSFAAFQNTAIVGADGGWWLPILAHRETTVPPLTYAAELGTTPDFAQKVHMIYDVVKDSGTNSPETLEMLRAEKVDLIYIGQRHGSVNNHGPALLDPVIISTDPHYQLLYNQDRVWIFSIKP